jgi:hypothetical protein
MKPEPAVSIPHFKPVLIPQGDGSYLVKPGKPILEREQITIREAVKRFGMSKQTWARLYDTGLIEGQRPAPRKTLLFVDSIQSHFSNSADPEFWNKDKSTVFRAR